MRSVPVSTELRLGRINYLNCLPFYHGLLSSEEGEQVYETYPSKVNLAMRHGKIDIAPISSLEYLNHREQYLLLPGLGIGSRDFSGSVILFARDRVEGLDGARIALTRHSLSSATLLRVLLKFKYKFKNRFVSMRSDLNAMLAKCDAGLIIGDEALFPGSQGFLYKHDLSELWWNWTEKPFCFALWAVRRDCAKKNPEAVRALASRIRENRDRNLADIEGLIRNTLNMTFLDKKFSKIYGYLFNLSFGMDAEQEDGLQLFYRLAHRLGTSPRPEKLEFFE